MKHITASQFAECLGITPQAATKAFRAAADGQPWHSHMLPVVELIGCRGGAAGRTWGLVVDALDPELKSKFDCVKAPVKTNLDDVLGCVSTDRMNAIAKWRWFLVREALSAPEGAERAATVGRIASSAHYFEGNKVTVSTSTVYRWLNAYFEGGFSALTGSARADRGKNRVLISRKWDGEIDLDEDSRILVSAAMEAYAKRFVSSDGSLRKLAHIGARRLAELCRDERSTLSAPELASLCKLNSKWTDRFAKFKRVARKSRDAKLHFDHDQPRIQRSRSEWPSEVVFGDVHPVDLWVTKDGTKEQVRVRLIAWQDDCTHMMSATPILFLKGRGVRQSDIVDSFYDLVVDPHFGLPATTYLDNGSEYSFLWKSFERFPDLKLVSNGHGVIKAKPYNGPAKGLIEGAFQSLEKQFIKHIGGYIGGDRTNKKTQSVGKPPAPFGGTYVQLLTRLEEVVAIYNDTPQSGRLGGLSPREALAEAVSKGWAATGMDELTFNFVFSSSRSAMVTQGAFQTNGVRYYSDEIAKLGHRDRLEIKVPFRTSTDKVAVMRNNKMLGYAAPDVMFGTTDLAGAKEATRRSSLQNHDIKMMRKEAGHPIDLHAEAMRFTETSPIATEFGRTLSISDQRGFATKEQLIEEEALRSIRDQDWDRLRSYQKPEKQEVGGSRRQPLKTQLKKD